MLVRRDGDEVVILFGHLEAVLVHELHTLDYEIGHPNLGEHVVQNTQRVGEVPRLRLVCLLDRSARRDDGKSELRHEGSLDHDRGTPAASTLTMIRHCQNESMSSQNVLVIGANRGIGLGLVRRYLSDGWTVHATTRTPETPGELGSLTGDVHIYRFDVVEDPVQLISYVGNLDLLIHNAGVGRRTPRQQMMAVNAEAPIRVVQAFVDSGSLTPNGKVAIMTSQMGARRGSTESLGDYGDSKAALNDEFRARTRAWGEAGVVAVVVHPGWVRTDMGGSSAPLSVEESVDGIVTLIDGMGSSEHGRFWNWDGREHPW